MDTIDMLKTAGLSSTGLLIVLIAYRVFKAMNGHRVVSSCCGKKMDMGFAVEVITPLPTQKQTEPDRDAEHETEQCKASHTQTSPV